MTQKITLIATLLILFLLNIVNAQEYTKCIYVQKIEDNNIVYNPYEYRWLEINSINVSNLDIDNQYHETIRKTAFKSETDIIVDILSKGYAKLIDVNKASKIEIEAENLAKQKRIGVWTKIMIEKETKILDFIDTTNLCIDKKYIDAIMEKSLPEKIEDMRCKKNYIEIYMRNE